MTKLTEVVKTFYESEDALFTSLSNDVEWQETEGMPYGGIYHGTAALFEGVFSHIRTDWDRFSAMPESIVAVGDNQVLSIGRYNGVFKKTGKRLDAAFAHVYTFADGKVVRFQQFGDSATFCAAMH